MEIYSSTTIVRWHGDQLEGLPYITSPTAHSWNRRLAICAKSR